MPPPRKHDDKKGLENFCFVDAEKLLYQHKNSFSLADVILPHSAYKLKCAFTLAEVLITLGIIGIVAAMTMPALIANHRKKVFTTKVKYTYNIVSNALLSSVAENGAPNTWDFGSKKNSEGNSSLQDPEHTKQMAQKYFRPYFKVIREGSDDNGYYIVISNGITLTFNTDGSTDSSGIYTPSALYIIASFNNNTKQYWASTRDYSKTDIFMTININEKNARVKFFNWGGETRNGIINESHYGCSNRISKNRRYGCAALIQHDGWEIKDDYPW